MRQNVLTDWADVPIVMDLIYASRIVGVSPEYLKKRAQKGDFPAYKEGNQWRITKDALMRHVGVIGGRAYNIMPAASIWKDPSHHAGKQTV